MQSCTCPAQSKDIYTPQYYRIPSAMAEDVTHTAMYTPCRCASPWPTTCAQSTLKALQDQVALYAACFLQLCMMARASTVGGNAVFNEDSNGIHADLQVDDVGLTYVIRFLKGWSPGVHAFRGDKLPILRDGADTFPWERQGADLKPDSPRNRVLTLLQYASQNKILGRLNRAKPDSMEAILNEFLRSQKIDDLLLSETKITSHR